MFERYNLIAVYNDVSQDEIGGNFVDHYSKEIVATFDSEEMAKDYIRKSRLKNEIRKSFSSVKRFKSRSLLSQAEYAEIENIDLMKSAPHNPSI